MARKKSKKRGNLRVVPRSGIDQQVTEALDRLLSQEDLSWEEAEKHLSLLNRHVKRVLPRFEEIIHGGDVALAESAIQALQYLDAPEVGDLLLQYVYDSAVKDDVRLAIMGTLQSRGVEVDEETFFLSLHDAPGMFQRMHERLLDDLGTNLLMRQATVESARDQGPEQFADWIEFITESTDPRSLYVLLPLLHLDDDDRVRQIIQAVDKLRHPAAIPGLAELAEWHSSQHVREAARTTLGRLTMRGSARPAEQPLPPTPLPPLERAYLSTIDGDGGQAIGVIRRQPNGLLTVLSIAVNDHQGVRNCFASPDIPADEWALMLEEMSEDGTFAVDVPLSTCRRVFEEARRLTMQVHLALPLDAEAWRDMFLGEDLPGVTEPVAPTLTPAQAEELLPDTGDLLDAEYFSFWFFNFEEIEPFLDEALDLEEDQWDRFAGKVVRRLAIKDVRDRLRARLERQAALLAGLDEDDLARLAMAAAWGLSPEAKVKPQDHPFLLEMAEASFDNVWEGEMGESPYPHWGGPLPQTEDEWRAFIAEADSPTQVISAWFEQNPPADIDQANEIANYVMALWNTTPRPELGGRAPNQVAGVPAPPIPPIPQPAVTPGPPPGPPTADDVFDLVDEYYHESIDWEPQLAQAQVEGYLREALKQGAGPEVLMERWNDLSLFHFFLNHYGQEIQTLDDLQPYHLSEWVTDFLDRKIMGRVSVAQKRQALETVRSLYAYLAQVGQVEDETARSVSEAVDAIAGSQRGLWPIQRPDPLGGETMLMVYHPTAGEFVYTLNDVWLVQVCHAEFMRDWRQMRKEARKVPGATLKLRLIDRLQLAQKQGQDPFSVLYSYPPTPEDLDEALHRFHEGEMTEDRAW